MRRFLVTPVVVAVVAGAIRAQEGESAPSYLHFEGWRRASVAEESGRALAEGSSLPSTESRWRRPIARDPLADELAAALAKEPPPIARETLEGTAEELQPYHGLPGGIVLGLSARAPAELDGARVELDGGMRVCLRLADGRLLRLPSIEPESLRACARFVSQRLDGVVDLQTGNGTAPRLAPAFAGSVLERLLLGMDALPHRMMPETRVWKSLIVDSDVRVVARGEELALAADLEVRFYDEEQGWGRRMRTVEACGADLVGPRAAGDLGPALAPLAEIAAWLGFLRWIERVDPAGFAALQAH